MCDAANLDPRLKAVSSEGESVLRQGPFESPLQQASFDRLPSTGFLRQASFDKLRMNGLSDGRSLQRP